MNATSKCIAFFALAVSAAAASAQWYADIGYTAIRVRADTANPIEASPNAHSTTIGYEVHKNVGVEALFLFGISEESVKVNGVATGNKLKVNNAYGLLIRPKAQISENLEVFGRLGYAKTRLALSGVSLASADNDGLAYGLGASYCFGKSVCITGNYMSLYERDVEKMEGLTLGIGVKF